MPIENDKLFLEITYILSKVSHKMLTNHSGNKHLMVCNKFIIKIIILPH